jgi:PAS domain S-box-containing protein
LPLAQSILQRLIEASPDIVVATDARGTVAYYNDGARENLGYTREEIIGCEVWKLYPSLEQARRVMRAMRGPDHGGPGRVIAFPTTFLCKDGRELPVAISGVVIRTEGGLEDGTIGFAKDISAIVRKDKLELLGEVAVGLSHEINNPLAAIANYVSLLERFVLEHDSLHGAVGELRRIGSIRSEIRRIEVLLARLRTMAEKEEYASTPYLGEARMIDLSPGSACSLSGRRMLVVDDDPAVRDSVVQVLQAEGCRVVSCSNGREALDWLGRDAFDLVVSDVVMPELDGYQLLLAARDRHPETKVVLMTAFYHDKDHILKRSRLAGLEGVLFKKPLDPEKLRKTLAELLRPARPAPSGH